MKKDILGVGITAASIKDVLEYIQETIENKEHDGEKFFIVTPNPEIIVYASNHENYKKMLNQAAISLPDGVGIMIASKLLQRHIAERVTGVDFMKLLCEKMADRPITVGFLGGRDKVAERTAECLQRLYPALKVRFVGQEWEEKSQSKDQRSKTEKENLLRPKTSSLESEIDILFVAFGFPKQEEWMAENIHKRNVRVMMGVGGAFDYISGNVPRAPKFMRSLGLEWLYRLIRQPWRWRRQLALIEFIGLILKEKFRRKEKGGM